MKTGNEPMLPQHDDNAPMISSVQTKAITDLRGAYLAGNVRALIEKMDENQQQRFRQAILAQGLYYLEYLSMTPGSPQHQAAEIVQGWLKKPTAGAGTAIRDILREAQLIPPAYQGSITLVDVAAHSEGLRLGRALAVLSRVIDELPLLEAANIVAQFNSALFRRRVNSGIEQSTNQSDWLAYHWQAAAARARVCSQPG